MVYFQLGCVTTVGETEILSYHEYDTTDLP